jgi:hypothetical protein
MCASFNFRYKGNIKDIFRSSGIRRSVAGWFYPGALKERNGIIFNRVFSTFEGEGITLLRKVEKPWIESSPILPQKPQISRSLKISLDSTPLRYNWRHHFWRSFACKNFTIPLRRVLHDIQIRSCVQTALLDRTSFSIWKEASRSEGAQVHVSTNRRQTHARDWLGSYFKQPITSQITRAVNMWVATLEKHNETAKCVKLSLFTQWRDMVGSRGTALLILNFCCRWRSVVNFNPGRFIPVKRKLLLICILLLSHSLIFFRVNFYQIMVVFLFNTVIYVFLL